MLVPHFIDNIFRSRLTLVSSKAFQTMDSVRSNNLSLKYQSYYTIRLQRYRDRTILVCDKDLVPLKLRKKQKFVRTSVCNFFFAKYENENQPLPFVNFLLNDFLLSRSKSRISNLEYQIVFFLTQYYRKMNREG